MTENIGNQWQPKKKDSEGGSKVKLQPLTISSFKQNNNNLHEVKRITIFVTSGQTKCQIQSIVYLSWVNKQETSTLVKTRNWKEAGTGYNFLFCRQTTIIEGAKEDETYLSIKVNSGQFDLNWLLFTFILHWFLCKNVFLGSNIATVSSTLLSTLISLSSNHLNDENLRISISWMQFSSLSTDFFSLHKSIPFMI